jgi:hypothetical protein
MERLDGKVNLLAWMTGVNTGLTLLVVCKLFS